MGTQRNGEHGKPWHVSVSPFEGNWRHALTPSGDRLSLADKHWLPNVAGAFACADLAQCRPWTVFGGKYVRFPMTQVRVSGIESDELANFRNEEKQAH